MADSTKTRKEDIEWGQAVLPSESVGAKDNSAAASTEDVEVAIVGGGLAGLAMAIGLHYRANIPCVKVYERAPQLRSISQGILCIQPNGMNALERIHPDLPTMIAKAGCERHELVLTTIQKDGTVEESIKETGQQVLQKFGRIKIGITWHKMQQLLASLLPPDVVVTSRSLVSFQEDDKSVVLHFDDCHTTPNITTRHCVRAKAVVACDGVFSVARRQILPDDDDAPIYFGQLNWGTVIETEKLPPNVHPPNAVHFFSHEGDPRWMSMLNDGGSGQTFWQFRLADPDQALLLSRNKGRGGLGLKGVKEALLPVAQPSELVSQAIQCIPEGQIFERSIVGRLPASTWISSGGRVVLVGDSAHGMHPNISQGANSSFESVAAAVDAMALEFQHRKVDWCKAALKTYQDQRKPKADIVQRLANMMGCYQATGSQTHISKEDLSQVMDWILGGDPNKYPSQQTLDSIWAFDPLSQKGVSKIV